MGNEAGACIACITRMKNLFCFLCLQMGYGFHTQRRRCLDLDARGRRKRGLCPPRRSLVNTPGTACGTRANFRLRLHTLYGAMVR